MENTLLSGTESSSSKILAKPSNNKRKTWVSLVENVVKNVGSTNVELTISLERISSAEKIPVKWNRINKPKFMTFLNNISGYHVNPKIDEQSWDLISKALKEERKSKEQNNTRNDKNKNTATNGINSGENGKKKTNSVTPVNGNVKLKKEVESSGSPVKGISFEEKRLASKLAKKLAKQKSAKQKLIDNAEWTKIVQNLIGEVGDDGEELISHLQRISHAPNIPQKSKWSSMNRQNFMTFLMNIPAYKVDPTITDRLWNLITKCLNESQKKKKNVKNSVKAKTVTKEQERKQTWMTLCQIVICNNEDKKLTKSLETLSKAPKIPRHLSKVTQDQFMAFLQNVPSFQMNPAVDEKIWSLFTTVLEQQMKNNALKVGEMKQENAVVEKGTKRKGTEMSGNLPRGSKKMKKQAKENALPIKECSSNNDNDHAVEADNPLSPLGKHILQNKGDKKLVVKKSGKKKSLKKI